MIDGWAEKSNKLTKQTKHRYSRGEENRESYKVRNKAGSKLENRLTHTNRKMRYFFQSQYTTLKDVSIPKVVQER